jgi:hypothetical protein
MHNKNNIFRKVKTTGNLGSTWCKTTSHVFSNLISGGRVTLHLSQLFSYFNFSVYIVFILFPSKEQCIT